MRAMARARRFLDRRLTPAEAAALQEELRGRVVERPLPAPRTVAGVDLSARGGDARAAVCVLSFPGLELVEEATAVRPMDFPYVPGLLAFREVPAILDAYAKLAVEPDVLLVDGHGRAHPRRFGVACHLGVELDRPAVGVGKSRLVGRHREPGPRRGARTRLVDGDELLGACLRTRDGVKPVYVSVGHRVALDDAVRLVLRCAPRYRLPEPIRRADRVAGAL